MKMINKFILMKLLNLNFGKEKYNLLSITISIALIYILLIFYFKKIHNAKKIFKIPIICVGNIYLVVLVKRLWQCFYQITLKTGKKPLIIKKYYKNHYDEMKLKVKSKA